MKGNWARWLSSAFGDPIEGWGRWHVLAALGQDEAGHNAVILACGRARHEPQQISSVRPPEPRCDECETFDDMRRRYVPETADAPAERELVPA